MTLLDKPVHLYIKRHNVTGLLYFGRTINPIAESYNGSGTHWNNHLNFHGLDISTVMFETFTNEEDLLEFATFFSEEFDIVRSNKWANLIPEDGIHKGNLRGFKHSAESLAKMSKAQSGKNHPNYGKNLPECVKEKIAKSNTGQKRTEETKNNISIATKKAYSDGNLVSPWSTRDQSGENNSFYGKTHTQETLDKISKAKTGVKITHKLITCPHCSKEGLSSGMKRWHFNNCKLVNPNRKPNKSRDVIYT